MASARRSSATIGRRRLLGMLPPDDVILVEPRVSSCATSPCHPERSEGSHTGAGVRRLTTLHGRGMTTWRSGLQRATRAVRSTSPGSSSGGAPATPGTGWSGSGDGLAIGATGPVRSSARAHAGPERRREERPDRLPARNQHGRPGRQVGIDHHALVDGAKGHRCPVEVAERTCQVDVVAPPQVTSHVAATAPDRGQGGQRTKLEDLVAQRRHDDLLTLHTVKVAVSVAGAGVFEGALAVHPLQANVEPHQLEAVILGWVVPDRRSLVAR